MRVFHVRQKTSDIYRVSIKVTIYFVENGIFLNKLYLNIYEYYLLQKYPLRLSFNAYYIFSQLMFFTCNRIEQRFLSTLHTSSSIAKERKVAKLAHEIN